MNKLNIRFGSPASRQGYPVGNLKLGRRFTSSERVLIRKGKLQEVLRTGKRIPSRAEAYELLFGFNSHV